MILIIASIVLVMSTCVNIYYIWKLRRQYDELQSSRQVTEKLLNRLGQVRRHNKSVTKHYGDYHEYIHDNRLGETGDDIHEIVLSDARRLRRRLANIRFLVYGQT